MNPLQKVEPVKIQAIIVMYYLLRKNKPGYGFGIMPGRYKITIHKDGFAVFTMMLPVPGVYDIEYEPFQTGSAKIQVDAVILGTDTTAYWEFGPAILAEMQKSYEKQV
jgi:hypothetical protein